MARKNEGLFFLHAIVTTVINFMKAMDMDVDHGPTMDCDAECTVLFEYLSSLTHWFSCRRRDSDIRHEKNDELEHDITVLLLLRGGKYVHPDGEN